MDSGKIIIKDLNITNPESSQMKLHIYPFPKPNFPIMAFTVSVLPGF